MADGKTTITEVKIQNFKGFVDLQLKGFSNFNLFIGQNNIGKTSVLEALAFALGFEPNNFFRNVLAETRKTFIDGIKQYKNIFHQFQIGKSISIDCRCAAAYDQEQSGYVLKYEMTYIPSQWGEEDDQIKIACQVEGLKEGEPDLKNEREVSIKEINARQLPQAPGMGKNIRQDVFTKPSREYHVNVGWRSEDGNSKYLKIAEDYVPVVQLVSNDFNLSKQELDCMTRREIRGKVLDFIRQIDSRIDEIQAFNNSINIYYHDLQNPFSLNSMGTGFIKIIKLYLAIISNELGPDIILFDEIADGLHPDTMKILLKFIIPELTSKNIQLFSTTHSYDLLSEVALYEGKEKESMAVYYLFKDKKAEKIQGHRYSQEDVAELNGFADLRRV